MFQTHTHMHTGSLLLSPSHFSAQLTIFMDIVLVKGLQRNRTNRMYMYQ